MPGPGVTEGDGSASLFFDLDKDSLAIVTAYGRLPLRQTMSVKQEQAETSKDEQRRKLASSRRGPLTIALLSRLVSSCHWYET